MFSKVLVANRGEIAVRGFRAAVELGLKTVAVFPYEDRNADHRIKAHESYLIGSEGHPVRAYLDIDEIIRVAKESGADAIYPGYGFLSENSDFARAVIDAGLTWVGPSPEAIDALLEIWPIFEAFQLAYVSKGLLLEQEKNVSAPSPNGPSAGASDTAKPARKPARTARRG